MVILAFMIKSHYSGVGRLIKKLDTLSEIPLGDKSPPEELDKKAEEKFGFKPETSFKEGLEKTINWFYDNFPELEKSF